MYHRYNANEMSLVLLHQANVIFNNKAFTRALRFVYANLIKIRYINKISKHIKIH